MLNSGVLRVSECGRPFWLLVALAVMLLALVSVSVARAATPERLMRNLERELGALQLQLERIEPQDDEIAGRRLVAFNADLADGGPAFRQISMRTILRAALRHAERLVAVYPLTAGSEASAVHDLRRSVYQIGAQIDELGRTDDPALREALRDSIRAMLDVARARLAAVRAALARPRLAARVTED